MVGSRGAGAEEEAAAVLASVTEKAVVASQRLAAEEAATARMVWQATGGAEEAEAVVLASAERCGRGLTEEAASDRMASRPHPPGTGGQNMGQMASWIRGSHKRQYSGSWACEVFMGEALFT